MNAQECLERAMFAAAESYSHSAYLDDLPCEESEEKIGESAVLISEGPVTVAYAA